MELKEKLVQLRKKNGLSQLDLSEKLNVSRQAISKWEVGTTTPSVDNLKSLCSLYSIPLEYLLHDGISDVSKKDEDEISDHAAICQSQISNETSSKELNQGNRRRSIAPYIIIGIIILVCIVATAFSFNQPNQTDYKLNDVAGEAMPNTEDVFNFEW